MHLLPPFGIVIHFDLYFDLYLLNKCIPYPAVFKVIF